MSLALLSMMHEFYSTVFLDRFAPENTNPHLGITVGKPYCTHNCSISCSSAVTVQNTDNACCIDRCLE